MTLHDIDSASIPAQMKTQLKTLRSAPVFHNMLGVVPTSCSWTIKVDDMERYVYNIAKEYLGNEVRMVTIEPNQSKTREPYTYVWLKADSTHLVDTKTGRNINNVINVRVDRYSDALKQFADLYAPEYRDDGSYINRKKRIQPLPNSRGDKSIVAIPMSLTRLCRTIFDTEAKSFQETFGSDVPILKCDLHCVVKFIKRGDTMEMTHIVVTKSLPGKSGGGKPSPRRSFSDRSGNGNRAPQQSNLTGIIDNS